MSAVNGGRSAVKVILTAIKTIIASQKHIIAGINGFWIQPAAITVQTCV